MDKEKLTSTAKAMVAYGKGILAIDESSGTIKKRFDSINVEDSVENHRIYRQLLITAPGVGDFISGYILYDETIRQKADDGTPFPKVLKSAGVIPGIKVDTGAKDFALHLGEKTTEGLDGLRERFQEYADLGAGFAKWRSVYKITDDLPSEACHRANAHGMARYAALAQEAGIVPMVEPEILYDDGDHSIERCAEVCARAWDTLFEALKEQGIMLEGTILKTSMILAGKDNPVQSTPKEIAEWTIKTLKEHVPAELAGIVFLSGGQTPEQATENLQAMHEGQDYPWPLTFSYSRAIQGPALKIWGEDQGAVEKAQAALIHRAKANSLASKGEYTKDQEENRGY